jgi:hypothetical protein
MNSSLTPERKSEIMLQNISTSDCGVIAAQAVTGLNRQKCVDACTKDGDYQEGQGIARGGLNRTLLALGYKLTMIRLDPHETVATLAMRCEYGKFLVYTDGHVSALIDGYPHNARGDWHTPVEEAYKVEARS